MEFWALKSHFKVCLTIHKSIPNFSQDHTLALSHPKSHLKLSHPNAQERKFFTCLKLTSMQLDGFLENVEWHLYFLPFSDKYLAFHKINYIHLVKREVLHTTKLLMVGDRVIKLTLEKSYTIGE